MNGENGGWLRRRLRDPLVALLKQGTTPEQVALALATGAVIGVFPFVGATTTLCVAAGLALRLNQAALQVANYAVYPLQLAMLIPFLRLGAAVFDYELPVDSVEEVVSMVEGSFWGAAAVLWGAVWRAAALWALAAIPAVAAVYLPLRRLTRRLAAGLAAKRLGR